MGRYYSADIAALVENFGLVPHLHADDTQAYGWSSPALIEDCLRDYLRASTTYQIGCGRTTCS